MILPLFGFANAGVALSGMTMNDLLSPVPVGVALGLFWVNRQVSLACRYWPSAGPAKRPEKSTRLQVYGVSVLCGIGFTMSLFIGNLAFTGSPLLVDEVKVGFWQGPYWPLWPVF
nr:Na+/H+ antiporter NhaA [Klebsiella pneumoniae]